MPDYENETEFDLSGLDNTERDTLITILRENLGEVEIWTNENDEEVIRIPRDTADLIKHKISRSLRRNDLSTQIIRLGTEGFVEFLFTMLRPFLEPNSSGKLEPNSSGKNDKGTETDLS